MCSRYEVARLDGAIHYATNSNELAEALGCEISALPGKHGVFEDNDCLCDLDLDAFEATFGYEHGLNEDGTDELLSELAK